MCEGESTSQCSRGAVVVVVVLVVVVVVVYRQRRIHSSRVKGIEIPLRMETFRYKSKTKIKFSKPIAKLLSKIYYSQPIRAIVCLKYSFRAPHFAFQVHICATNHDAKS